MKPISLLFLALIIFSCTEETINNNNLTQLNIHMTDGPDDYEEVNIDLQLITIKGAEGARDSIELGTAAGIYNLLDFQNGLDTLVATGTVDIDFIKEVRFILGDNNSIMLTDSTIHDLKTPSAQQSGLKIKLNADLTQADIFDLILDFDVEESIVETGNGGFILKPVIKVVQ